MQAALRQKRQPAHEAKHHGPPAGQPRPFCKLPENDVVQSNAWVHQHPRHEKQMNESAVGHAQIQRSASSEIFFHTVKVRCALLLKLHAISPDGSKHAGKEPQFHPHQTRQGRQNKNYARLLGIHESSECPGNHRLQLKLSCCPS